MMTAAPIAGISAKEILGAIGGVIANPKAGGSRLESAQVQCPSALGDAGSDCVAFFFAPEYQNELRTARPAILVTAEPFVKPIEASGLPIWAETVIVVCRDPYWAMAKVSELFSERLSTVAHRSRPEKSTISPQATISSEAKIGNQVTIGAGVVVEAGAVVGDGATLYPGAYLGRGASLGSDSVLFPHAAIYERVQIGARVRIHANSVVGSDGFGYAAVRNGATVQDHQKIYHLGTVRIGDDVELGACVTIDRGTFADTVIGNRVKLDNQVHVGHNCRLDEGAIVCGGTCLAGGATVGRYAYVGGLSGVNNRVHIGDGAQVGALTIVTKDVAPGGQVLGNPGREPKEHFEVHAILNRLRRTAKKNRNRDSKETNS